MPKLKYKFIIRSLILSAVLIAIGMAPARAEPQPTPALKTEEAAQLEARLTQSLMQREPHCAKLENRSLIWRAVTLGASTAAATLGGGSLAVSGGWETGLQIAGVVLTTVAATAGLVSQTYASRHERDCSIPSLLSAGVRLKREPSKDSDRQRNTCNGSTRPSRAPPAPTSASSCNYGTPRSPRPWPGIPIPSSTQLVERVDRTRTYRNHEATETPRVDGT